MTTWLHECRCRHSHTELTTKTTCSKSSTRSKKDIVSRDLKGGAFYLERRWLLVYWCDEDHQLVIDAQVAEDVTLWHRDVKPQDLQDVMDRHRLVLIQLHAEVEGKSVKYCPTLK